MPKSQTPTQSPTQTPTQTLRYSPEELLKAPKKAKNSKVHPDTEDIEVTDNSHNHAARQLNF